MPDAAPAISTAMRRPPPTISAMAPSPTLTQPPLSPRARERLRAVMNGAPDLLSNRVAATFLQRCGAVLRLKQSTVAAAGHYFYRFRALRVAAAQDDPEMVLTTSLFLAAKVAEQPRKIRDVINTASRVQGRPLVELDQAYWQLKAKLVATEQQILRALAFDVEVDDVFLILATFAAALRCRPCVAHCAWALANDSLQTAIGTTVPARAVAAAAVYVASRCMGHSADLPPVSSASSSSSSSASNGKRRAQMQQGAWWHVFGVSTDDMEKAAGSLSNLLHERTREPQAETPLATSQTPRQQAKKQTTAGAGAGGGGGGGAHGVAAGVANGGGGFLERSSAARPAEKRRRRGGTNKKAA